MAAVDDIFISKITLWKKTDDEGGLAKADDFDLSFLVTVTFIETIDISGPRLILVMDDPDKYIMEVLGATPRDALEVTFSSNWYDDGDTIDLVMMFRILTMPHEVKSITFNCIEKEVEMAKRPSKKAQFFVKKPLEEILPAIVGLGTEIGKFPVILDYHILPGMRPAKLIRQMCHEMKAACFNRRGILVYEKWSKLLAQAPDYTYHHTPPPAESCDEEIHSYQMLRVKEIVRDRVERNYMSWDLTSVSDLPGGLISAEKPYVKPIKPQEWASQPSSGILGNLNTAPFPTIDLQVAGEGNLRCGKVMKIIWHTTQRETMPIDESLPKQILLSTVAHYYSGSNYLCRIKGIRLD